ncbi:MAG: PA14 domain-containing protein [Haloarculaceae archaeon]
MRPRGEERGQAVQIGAVLLFGFLVLTLSTAQATLVPQQNERVEFDHNERVQSDMTSVRNEVVSAARTAGAPPVAVELGTRYPSRFLLVNPSPVSGSLRTVGSRTVRVENATAVTSETADYRNGTTRRYRTTRLVYTPEYNVYGSAPSTVLERGLLYNRHPGANITLAGGTPVDGRRLTLVTLNGTVSESGVGPTTVDPVPTSPAIRTVTVRDTDGDPITVRVSTGLTNSTWQSLLETELVSAGGHVAGFDCTNAPPAPCGVLTLVLEPDVTYELRMARVGLGRGVVEPDAAYLTTVDGGGDVATGENRTLVVEVRDRFDNGVSGVRVNVTDAGSLLGSVPESRTTDESGRASFEYRAPGTATAETLTLAIDDGSNASERVSFTLNVEGPGGGGGGTGGRYDLAWDTTTIDGQSGVSYVAANDTVLVSDPGTVQMTAIATNGSDRIDGVGVDYASNASTVAAFTGSDTEGTTGSDGRSTVDADAGTGLATVYASAAEGGDAIRVRVKSDGNGARYEYYEDTAFGNDDQPSDLGLDSKSPVRTGIVDRFDLSLNSHREDDFAFKYTAYIDVPSGGTYTFYTESDDGSWLYVDGSQVVDNGGDHAARERSGTVSLTEGQHNVTAYMYENRGVESLRASWDGPGFSKQEIPESVLAPRVPGGGGGGGTNTAPSVTIDSITPNEAGRSDKVKTVDVSFTPDDADGNLDSATVVVRVDGTEQGRKENVDITGREGQSVDVNVDNTDSKGTVEVTVEAADVDGKTGSDTKSENEA